MNRKETSEKVLKIIKDYKSQSNKDLLYVLDFLQEDFNKTKETVITLTHHIDKVENTYNLILKEYEERTKTNANR